MGNKKALRVSETQLQGHIYQSLFSAEILKRGFFVEKSEMPLPWDFTVTNPQNIKAPLRVQVKGTNCLLEGRRYRITSKVGTKGNTEAVNDSIVDVAAYYVEAHNVWYNIPTGYLASTQAVWLYPNSKNSKAKYECWRNDWSIYRA